jgi:hypothetical protein
MSTRRVLRIKETAFTIPFTCKGDMNTANSATFTELIIVIPPMLFDYKQIYKIFKTHFSYHFKPRSKLSSLPSSYI